MGLVEYTLKNLKTSSERRVHRNVRFCLEDQFGY